MRRNGKPFQPFGQYPERNGVPIQTSPPRVRYGRGPTVRNQVILFVEDELLIRFVLADALRDVGYDVVEAATGEEALDILDSPPVIDLIITDVRMPGQVDGLQVARRSKGLAPARPVIICSAHLLKSEASPADEFLAKPYTVADLLEATARLIGDPWQKNSNSHSA